MIFTEEKLKGAYIIDIEKREDSRGFFSRVLCVKEFQAYGLCSQFLQANISFSGRQGTLRGLHWQIAPFEEVKVIRCIRGGVYDVIIDLRPESSTYKKWVSVVLTADNHRALYVPKGFAHGYQTLEDNTELFYQASQYYNPESEHGVRWNDPTFGIAWPECQERTISEKDSHWRDYDLELVSGIQECQ